MTNNSDILNNNKLKFYALCGVIAPIFFWLMVIIESFLRPGYSQYYNFVSDLGVGPYSILQNINFIIFGVLTFGLALGLKTAFRNQGKKLEATVWFVVLFGLGVLLAGVFPESYLSANPHNIVSATAFVAVIAAQILAGLGLRNINSKIWGRYGTYSLISGLLSIILVILLKVAILYGIYPGLTQRAFLIVSWAWIGVTGIKLYLLTRD